MKGMIEKIKQLFSPAEVKEPVPSPYHGWIMTKELALEVKELRNRGTWRYVSEELTRRYPNGDFGDGNQLWGMQVCREACEFLEEDERDKPW